MRCKDWSVRPQYWGVFSLRAGNSVLLSVLLHSSVPAFLSSAFSPVPVGRESAGSLITSVYSVSVGLEKQLQPPRDRSSQGPPLIGRSDQVRAVIGGERSGDRVSSGWRERRHSRFSLNIVSSRGGKWRTLHWTVSGLHWAQLSADTMGEK